MKFSIFTGEKISVYILHGQVFIMIVQCLFIAKSKKFQSEVELHHEKTGFFAFFFVFAIHSMNWDSPIIPLFKSEISSF